MLSAKNRPIGQVAAVHDAAFRAVEFASTDASAYTGSAAILKSLLWVVKHETSQEFRGGEGMSDTATRPRLIFLPLITDYVFETDIHLPDKVW